MNAAQAWAAMLANPQQFLNNNQLTVASTGDRPSGLDVLQLVKRGQTIDGGFVPHYNEQVTATGTVYRQRWLITRVNADPATYVLPADQPTVVERLAYYVKMVDRDESAADTHFALPLAGGPDLMFTCQLTGCTFARGRQAAPDSCAISLPAAMPAGRR